MDMYYPSSQIHMFGGHAMPPHHGTPPSCSLMQGQVSTAFASAALVERQDHMLNIQNMQTMHSQMQNMQSMQDPGRKSPTPFGVQDILGVSQAQVEAASSANSRHPKPPVVHIAKRYDGNRNSSFGAAFVSEDEYDKIVATADVLDEVTALRLGLEYEATIPIGPLRRHRKERKARTVFTNAQLQLLEDKFKAQPRLTSLEREELAEHMKLSATQIRVWFQNKRAKMKRDKIQKDDEEATATRNSQPRADHGYNAYNSMGL